MERLRLYHPKSYKELAMEKIEYFDYQKVAREMKVPGAILKKIEKEVKEEFPKDKMMYELHVLRALRSKYWEKTVRLNKTARNGK
jgi:hypothetical protein